MAKLFLPNYVFLDNNGDPVAGGGVFFSASGGNTAKAIYTDTDLSVAATNVDPDDSLPGGQPLDSNGVFTQGDLYGSGNYRVTVRDSAGAIVTGWPKDDHRPIEIYTFNVKDYGVVGDNSTDDLAAIQAIENTLSALAIPTELHFPQATYAITDSILKKSNVHWTGPGKIRRSDNASPTGSQWALVFANEINDWSITGLSFETITQSVIDSTGLLRKGNIAAAGGWNSCIDAYKAIDWEVKDCFFTKFSQGIKTLGSGYFNIENNRMTSGNPSYTLANVLAGTAETWGVGSTGGVAVLFDEVGKTIVPLGPFTIHNNKISALGLNIGISVGLNSAGSVDGTVTNNQVEGCHTGIQLYQINITEDGTADTYNAGVIINNNRVRITWEQGIYVRGTIGVICNNNYIERAAQLDSGSDASYGGIVFRVNPFSGGASFTSAASVSDDHANQICNNKVVDTGRQGVIVPTCAIMIRQSNCKVKDNDIVNSAEEFTTPAFPAILVSLGAKINNFVVENNSVFGPFTEGVQVTDIARSANYNSDWGSIKNNRIELTSGTIGIEVNWYSFHVDIDDNYIRGATTGISLTYAPYSKIRWNKIFDATTGIVLSQGCLASDQPYLMSDEAETKLVRRGGTCDVYGNSYHSCTNAYGVTSTNGDDGTFVGRAAIYADETIDGKVTYPLEYAGGTPATSSNARSWHLHDQTKNTSVAGSVTPGKVCTTAGTYGSATTTTGDAVNSSPIITNVADFDGYGVGIYLNPSARFTAPVLIIDIDPTANTITVDQNASGATTGITLTIQAPVFKAIAALSA